MHIYELLKTQPRKEQLAFWFRWYDKQVNQAHRDARLGAAWDGATDQFGKTYQTVAELDEQAKLYQAELRGLKGDKA